MKVCLPFFIIIALFIFLSCVHLDGVGTGLTLSIKQGERISDVARQLEAMGLTTRKALLVVASRTRFPSYPFVPKPSPSLSRFEGLFRPGNIRFSAVEVPRLLTAQNPGQQALKNARVILKKLLARSARTFLSLKTVGGLSPYKQIILASIVEKEAAANSQYDLVASVFINRLKWGGRLASCPTVEYALGYHRDFLTTYDISIPTPYNVYRRKGLPPTPICFFSDKALNAIRHPHTSAYNFFVFDWTTNKLYFSRTYAEHKKNIQLARANYIRKYGYKRMFQIRYDKFYEE